MQYTDQQAYKYATNHAISSSEVDRIYKAVLFGKSKAGIERKAIGDPLEQTAYEYASRFIDLSNEERFRLHQAVFYGATAVPLVEEYGDHSLMPFGKHKGKKLINIPAYYLIWLYNDGCSHAGVRKYIIDNLAALQKEAGQKQKS